MHGGKFAYAKLDRGPCRMKTRCMNAKNADVAKAGIARGGDQRQTTAGVQGVDFAAVWGDWPTLKSEIAEELQEIEELDRPVHERWESLVDMEDRGPLERAEIRRLFKKKLQCSRRKRPFPKRDGARLSELLNEREIAELEKRMPKPNVTDAAERKITRKVVNRDLVVRAILQPSRLQAQTTRRRPRREIPTRANTLASVNNLSLIFQKIGVLLASERPDIQLLASEWSKSPALTMKRISAFVEACIMRRVFPSQPTQRQLEQLLSDAETRELKSSGKGKLAILRHEIQLSIAPNVTIDAADKSHRRTMQKARKIAATEL